MLHYSFLNCCIFNSQYYTMCENTFGRDHDVLAGPRGNEMKYMASYKSWNLTQRGITNSETVSVEWLYSSNIQLGINDRFENIITKHRKNLLVVYQRNQINTESDTSKQLFVHQCCQIQWKHTDQQQLLCNRCDLCDISQCFLASSFVHHRQATGLRLNRSTPSGDKQNTARASSHLFISFI